MIASSSSPSNRRWGYWRDYGGECQLRNSIGGNAIERISYGDAKVFVKVTKEAIQQSPDYQIPPLGDEYCDTRDFEENC